MPSHRISKKSEITQFFLRWFPPTRIRSAEFPEVSRRSFDAQGVDGTRHGLCVRAFSTGWCRKLWIESLGLPAVLPPEEEKDVKTAIGAARAKKARRELL